MVSTAIFTTVLHHPSTSTDKNNVHFEPFGPADASQKLLTATCSGDVIMVIFLILSKDVRSPVFHFYSVRGPCQPADGRPTAGRTASECPVLHGLYFHDPKPCLFPLVVEYKQLWRYFGIYVYIHTRYIFVNIDM